MEASTNYWVNQISHKRKPWLVRNIWWFTLGVAIVFSIMLITNPKEVIQHNRAVKHSIEKRIYPLVIETMQQEIRNESKDNPSNDKDMMNAISILLSELAETDFMSSITINGLTEEFAVDQVKNCYIYSIGYSDSRKMTIGLFGKTWMYADFMSDKKITDYISKQLNSI